MINGIIKNEVIMDRGSRKMYVEAMRGDWEAL